MNSTSKYCVFALKIALFGEQSAKLRVSDINKLKRELLRYKLHWFIGQSCTQMSEESDSVGMSLSDE